MRRRALVTLLAAVAAGGCGGDYPGSPQEVAKAYVATNSGSKCRFLTQRLIESLTDKQGEEARKACRRNVARVPKPKEVTLREAEVVQGNAQVEVLVDGSEAKLSMVRSGDRWKIAGFSE